MEETVQAASGMATPETAEATETPQAVMPMDKTELKSLLHEVVADIHADKTSQESLKLLIDAFNTGKNDLMLLFERIEAEIKKIANKN